MSDGLIENPFAAPESDVGKGHNTVSPAASDGFEFRKNALICPSPVACPDVCVKCGSEEPGGKVFNKTIYYCSPLVYFLILLNLLILIIVYLIVRKKCQVRYYLCHACAQGLKKRQIICGVIWVLFFGSLVGGAVTQETWMFGAMGIAFAVGLFAAYWASPPLRASGYSSPNFSIKGHCEVFQEKLERGL